MKHTAQQIEDAARQACFYVAPGGAWLRMQYADETVFCAMDEQSGEEYIFDYDEMEEEGEDPQFHKLVRIVIKADEGADWIEP